jgi:hypothetical protein
MLEFHKINSLFEHLNIYKSIFIYCDDNEEKSFLDYINQNSFTYVKYNNLFNFNDYFNNSIDRVLLISYEDWFINKVFIYNIFSDNSNLIVIGELLKENIDYIYGWTPCNNYIIELSDEII